MQFSNQQVLCEAIKKRLVVYLWYDHGMNRREVQPYAVFTSTKNNILLHCYQLKDESNPGSRNLEIDKISKLETTSTEFKPDSRFSIRNIGICERAICVIDSF